MNPYEQIQRTRREFFNTSASGLGGVALSSMLAQNGLLQSAEAAENAEQGPMQVQPPNAAPRAKSCIFFFMAGAPSQVDLFDPKPVLNERNGQSLPKEVLDRARFAFIEPDSATLLGTKRKFSKYGESGMEFSDLLPHLSGCADDLLMIRSMTSEEFNHHPGQLLMQCGVSRFGMPTMGSWITYGLGSESENLPGYVVLSARGMSEGV